MTKLICKKHDYCTHYGKGLRSYRFYKRTPEDRYPSTNVKIESDVEKLLKSEGVFVAEDERPPERKIKKQSWVK